MNIRLAGNTLRTLAGFRTMCAIAACFLASMFAGASAGQDDFVLQPQTRIKIAVVEWVTSLGEYKEWTALNGEYQVSSSGTISVPLIGNVAAAGMSSAAVAEAISNRLKSKTGLNELPATTVEIVRYPPVYVTGPVQKPGEVEFRPGLTVMQALAMAGGRERRTDNLGGYSEIDQIRYLGDLSRIDLQMSQLTARRARLQAELDGSGAIAFPGEFGTAPAGDVRRQFVKDEQTLFSARAEALAMQLKNLEELAALLESEIGVLEQKMVAQDHQIKTAEDELKDITRLVSDQTLTKSRQTSLERVVADLQSGKLDMVVASMRAKQKLSETRRDAINLKGLRKTDAGRDLQAAEVEIEDLKLRRVTTLQLLQSMGAIVSRKERQDAADFQPLEFWIARAGSGETRASAKEEDVLKPGDVLEVRYGISSLLDGEPLSSVNKTPGQPLAGSIPPLPIR